MMYMQLLPSFAQGFIACFDSFAHVIVNFFVAETHFMSSANTLT